MGARTLLAAVVLLTCVVILTAFQGEHAPPRWEYAALSLDWSSDRVYSESDKTYLWESPSTIVAHKDWREFQRLMGVEVHGESRNERRSVMHVIQKIGREGWELVSHSAPGDYLTMDVFYFKRPTT